MNFTTEQIAAIKMEGPVLCVDASAGSGKTLVLIERIQQRLQDKRVGLDNLVAMTFTDNAAAEMRDRLRVAFREAGNKAEANPDKMTMWRDLERRVQAARISTFHSFCMGLLKQHALRRGLDPDFTVLADAEAHLLCEEVMETTLHDLLNAGDEAAVRITSEHGVSKVVKALRDLLGRRYVIEQLAGHDSLREPDALFDLWRRRVQEEQARRIEQFGRLPEVKACVARLQALAGACTDESDRREQLRVNMLAIVDAIRPGSDPADVRADLEGSNNLAATGGSRKKWTSGEAFNEVKDIRDMLKPLINDTLLPAFDENYEKNAAQLTCDLYTVYERVAAALRAAKAERNGYDFDDLIIEAVHLLREDDEVSREVAQGITYLLIDEFQDTDSRQLEIADLLADQPGGPAVFIVGDAKQSIYLFRGAEVEVFEKARGQTAPEHVLRLTTNFRSVPDVLAFVNDFFGKTELLSTVEPVYRPIKPHRAAVAACRVEFLLSEKEEAAKRTDYRPLEAELIARRIAEMCCGSDPATVFDHQLEKERPPTFGDMALLFRSLSDAHIYERALKERGIPYTLAAGRGFYERQEVIDVRNLLALVVDPWDELALLGFLRSPIVGLSDDAVLRINAQGGLACAFHGSASLEDPLENALLVRARDLFNALYERRELPLEEFVRYVIDQTGYEAIALSQSLGLRKASNVRKVVTLACEFARSRPAKLSAFVRYLDEVAAQAIRESEAPLQPEGSDTVTLTTIHQAKGLEYPIVFIPDISRDAGPSAHGIVEVQPELGMAVSVTDEKGDSAKPVVFDIIQRNREKRELAEHARLLYVAMTRARDWLVLSGAPDLSHAQHSWLRAFQDCYGVLDKADGQKIVGEGWETVVRRTVTDCRATTRKVPSPALPPREAVEKRIQPVPVKMPSRKIFTVTELDKLMAGMAEEDRRTTDAASTSGGVPVGAKLWGTLVHRLLERWDFVSPVGPVIDALLKREHPAISVRNVLKTALEAVALRVQASDWGERLARTGPAQREVPFMLAIDDVLVSGTIDVMLEDGTIIDYKTGVYRPDLHTSYEWQICLYAAAVNQLQGKAPSSAYLYYVDTDREEDAQYPVDTSSERVKEALARAADAVHALRKQRFGEDPAILGSG